MKVVGWEVAGCKVLTASHSLLTTHDLRLTTRTTNTNPAFEAGHVREGEGVERSRVPWVLGGRRGVGDDALCWFLRRRPRAGFMPGPVRPRRVWIGNCRTGDRVDPFAP